MSRADAWPNRIIDAMVTALGALKAGDATKYVARAPLTVERGVPMAQDILNIPRPALFVRMQSRGLSEPFASGSPSTYRATGTFTVHVVTDSMNGADPEQELHRLISDVQVVFNNDPQLANGAATGLLSTGYLLGIEGYDPSLEVVTLSGIATASVPFTATWLWDSTNP